MAKRSKRVPIVKRKKPKRRLRRRENRDEGLTEAEFIRRLHVNNLMGGFTGELRDWGWEFID